MIIMMNSASNDSLVDALHINGAWIIRRITVEEALPIRHCVLWPDKTMEECRVEDDESGEHFGVYIDNKLVCVASVFIIELVSTKPLNKKQKTARLRKFATIEEYQGKGIGSFVLTHIIDFLQQESIGLFWCDARENAISFYERFGMSKQGERFYKGGIPYRKMAVIF